MLAGDPLNEDARFFRPPCRGNLRVQSPLAIESATETRARFIDPATSAFVTMPAQRIGGFPELFRVDREQPAAKRAGATLPGAQEFRLRVQHGPLFLIGNSMPAEITREPAPNILRMIKCSSVQEPFTIECIALVGGEQTHAIAEAVAVRSEAKEIQCASKSGVESLRFL